MAFSYFIHMSVQTTSNNIGLEQDVWLHTLQSQHSGGGSRIMSLYMPIIPAFEGDRKIMNVKLAWATEQDLVSVLGWSA